MNIDQKIAASHTVSSETHLKTILEKMMLLVISTSGAEKVLFLLKEDGDWYIEAVGSTGSEEYDLLLHKPIDFANDHVMPIPESIFNYCCRTKESLVVGNAMLDKRFAKDKLLQAKGIKSLVCIPVVTQGNIKAMIYLENNTMYDVFTPDRMNVLKHVSTQFGILLENTLLYEKLDKKIKALKESEERFRSIVENANEAIIVLQDYKMVYFNQKVLEISGYSSEEMPFLKFGEFIYPEDFELVKYEYNARISGKKPSNNYAIRIFTKEKQIKNILVNSKLVYWDSKPASLVMFSDITVLKQAESDLRISEQRYELAVSGSEVGIWDYNFISDKSYYSDRFKELMGYDPQELENLTLEEALSHLHPDFPEKLHIALQDHLEGKTPYYSIDYKVRMKSGEYRWFHARGMAIWDENGQATEIAGSFIDIHERKIGEEKLKKSEMHFRHLMESSPLAIAINTPDGKISKVNAAWKKLWGFNEEETVQVVANYNFLTDKQIENIGLKPLVEKAFKGESVILPLIKYQGNTTLDEIGLEDIEGPTRWVQVHIYPVKDAEGEIEHVVAINMDLTELVQAQQVAEVQRESLARIDRTSIMGQLTGSIAHELNQPLTGILANAQAAEMMLQSETLNSKQLSEILGDIVADTKRAGAVIRNLRDLYKGEKSVFNDININSMVEETVLLLHSELLKYDVKLKKIFAANIPEFKGNKIQIQQVLVNLIVNAIEAMNGYDVKQHKISITTSYNTREVKLYIDDKGPGIDKDKINSIFLPLATWKSGGTGMGLAISNSIIESHKGRMYAENLSGGGARVGFEIPIFNKN